MWEKASRNWKLVSPLRIWRKKSEIDFFSCLTHKWWRSVLDSDLRVNSTLRCLRLLTRTRAPLRDWITTGRINSELQISNLKLIDGGAFENVFAQLLIGAYRISAHSMLSAQRTQFSACGEISLDHKLAVTKSWNKLHVCWRPDRSFSSFFFLE